MVRLTSITTKGGDGGKTSLGDGRRVDKHDPRVEAYGDVDELNALVGLARAELSLASGEGRANREQLERQLGRIQQQLFDLGADLCVPGEAGERLRVPASHVDLIGEWVESWNEGLAPLTSFILPAGSRAVATLHLARAVCRRAERRVSQLAEREAAADGAGLNPQALILLNRLSDLLFIMARVAAGPHGEVLWTPGSPD